ncbi:ligand-binding sensor domain-containing diguanylate cyclase [Pseudoxanthomonas sp. GM95]|uniref:ligand-binding sensor domain-containing diguanylate cyclase n=1 Tax=Pseudoxanthomonas sp. GM95 TaxID=1881043 RepID=UPI0015874237|nr:ligand-binding sensor domain-containing diguanylate cyclase [Pseudoxanthomonas sp. GM95]
MALLLPGIAFAQATPPAAAAVSDPWAVFEQPSFDRVTGVDGLPHDATTALIQDAWGRLWLGTLAGLVRYDGQRMQLFQQGSQENGDLPDGYIRALLALDGGRLLVGTNAGGLALFDPGTRRFERIALGAGKILNTKIFTLRRARDGQIWVTSDLGLDRYDPASGRVTQVPVQDIVTSSQSTRIFDVQEEPSGRLWVGANPGLYVREPGQKAFSRVQGEGALAETLASDLVWMLYRDRKNRLWAGTGRMGVFVIEPDGRQWAPAQVSGQGGLTQGRTVRAFAELPDGRLWIATEGNGIVQCLQDCAQARLLQSDIGNPYSLSGDGVRDLLIDRGGNVWAATNAGLSRYDPNARMTLNISGSTSLAPELAGNSVASILVDDRKRIWLGLAKGGLEVIDLSAGTIRHVALPGIHAAQYVRAMLQVDSGKIWVGTLGVLAIDPDTLQVQGEVLPDVSKKRVIVLAHDGKDVLVGTYDGVYRMSGSSGEMSRFRHVPNDPDSLINDQVQGISEAGGRRWYATVGGLSVRRLDAPGLANLRHDPADPSSLPQNYVTAVLEDPRHQRLWVGTYGGLAWLQTPLPDGRYPFHALGVAEGMRDAHVDAIVVDDDGDLWASTARGITRVDGDTLQVAALGARDGLRIGGFSHDAGLRGPNGEVLFGGAWGLTVVRPQQVASAAEDSSALPLEITGMTVNGAARYGDAPPAVGQQIPLAEDERNILVDFALLDYRTPRETSYAYRLVGFDTRWNEVPAGVPPSAVYTNLPTGSYTLELRAQTRGLHARTLQASYPLVVAPRFFETWLARLLMLLSVLMLVLLVLYLSHRWSLRRASALSRIIDDRTRELRDANERLDAMASIDALTGLLTRRRALEVSETALQDARKTARPMSMLMIDLDHFKAVNDTWGHLAGDTALATASRTIAQRCRGADVVGRYGGEELMVCLPGSGAQGACELAERLRIALQELRIRHGEATLELTASIGVASLMEADRGLADVLARADQALYVAKRSGRNRVVLSLGPNGETQAVDGH